MKTIIKCIGEYKKYAILAPILIICESLFNVLVPYLMAGLVDKGLMMGNLTTVGKTGVLLALCTLLSLVFGVLGGLSAVNASNGFAKNLRNTMFKKIQTFSFENIDYFSTSGLINRITTDVSNVQNTFQMVLRIAVRAPSMLIFALIMAFKVNTKISFVFFITIPLLVIFLSIIMSLGFPLMTNIFKTFDKLNAVVQENIRGIRVVKSFTREDYEVDKFKKVSDKIYQMYSKAEKLMANAMPVMQLLIYSTVLAISWFSAHFIVKGTMTTGQLITLISYNMQILISLMMLSMVFVNLVISKASVTRIQEVLDEDPTQDSNVDGIKEMKNYDIEFKNVDFKYETSNEDENESLENINLKIPQGKTVGILGATGSGKTTLVSLIPRLYDATTGEIKIGGFDVKDYNMAFLRENISIVLQKNELFYGSIKDNLRWGNENATDEEIIKACEMSAADEFVNNFKDKYDTILEQGGSNLSGGQKQRLCIARAILKKPKILILDDSTSAVDTKTDLKIRTNLKNFMPDMTKIIIAQRIDSIKDSDIIVVIDKGTINAVGDHNYLMDQCEIYRQIYNSQTKEGKLSEN